jgi:hypothetical protein
VNQWNVEEIFSRAYIVRRGGRTQSVLELHLDGRGRGWRNGRRPAPATFRRPRFTLRGLRQGAKVTVWPR